jgi:hypothetical protein
MPNIKKDAIRIKRIIYHQQLKSTIVQTSQQLGRTSAIYDAESDKAYTTH